MLSKFKYFIGVFLLGLLLGPFSSVLFISIFHFPMVVPELIFIPILFKYYDRFGIRLDRKPIFMNVILLWLLFLLFAIVWKTWNLTAILSTGRSFLILGLFYVIGKNITRNVALLKFLLIVSIGSIVGWVIKSYLNILLLPLSDGYGESVVYGNMISIAIGFSIALLAKAKYSMLLAIFSLNVFLSFTTALRRQIIVSFMSLGLSLSLLSVKFKRFGYLVIVLIMSIPIYVALPQIEEMVLEISPNMHKRIFERSQNLIIGVSGHSEQSRIDNQFKIFSDFRDLIIPHGYVSQQTSTDAGTGIFNDVPIYMLSYSFGVIVVLFYLLYYFFRLVRSFLLFIRNGNVYDGVILVVGSVALFLHFVDSQMFTVSYSAPFTGLILGLLFRNDKLNHSINSI